MIAEKYGTTAKVLQKYNGITNANLLKIGQSIKIPSAGTTVENIKSPPRPAFHTVKKGDTFFAIANKYGVSPDQLKGANSKINPNKIYIGQKISIPGGSSEPAATAATEKTPPPAATPKYSLVKINKEVTLNEFAKAHGMTVSQVNNANGWTFDGDQLFAVGSEAYVIRK